MWVKDRNLLKPTGAYLLKIELKRLGISEGIIDEVLMAQTDEPLAMKALTSKSRLKNASFEKKAAFLQRRGFKTSIIFKILNPKC